MSSPIQRANAFCERFGLRVPIMLAPMAGACPPSLSVAVANAGGMGSAGVLLLSPTTSPLGCESSVRAATVRFS